MRRPGDRRDAKLLRDIDSMHFIMPLMYPNRCDNEAFISETIDLTNVMKYLEKKNAECNAKQGKKNLILTDPVCELEVREQIFRDIIDVYEKEGQIFLKPHPRDLLDYGEKFSGYPMFDATMPMEMLNFVPDLHFDKVVTVFTDLKGIEFADICIRLGDSFMDKYEKAEKHGFNLRAGITPIEADDKLGA